MVWPTSKPIWVPRRAEQGPTGPRAPDGGPGRLGYVLRIIGDGPRARPREW
jgi:hypothetical protein